MLPGSSSHATTLLATCCVVLGVAAPRSAQAGRGFVYVNANPDLSSNSVAAFRVAGDGQGTAISGSPFATGGIGLAPAAGAEFAHRIEVARSQNLLFAANDGSGSISVFKVDPLLGSLVPAPGSPFVVPGWSAFSGISLAASNDGRFLYASGTTVVSFFIAPDGGLSEVGSEWVFGRRVGGIGVSADNARVFLSTSTGVFILRSGDFGLTPELPGFLSIGSTPTDLRLDAAGTRLWVGTKSGGLLAYSTASGAETIVPGAPFFLGIPDLSGLSADFYGRFLFAYAPTGPRLLGAHTNLDGSLVLGPNSPLTPALAPTGGALIPDGSLLFLADKMGQLDAWSTEDSGALTHVAGYPLATSATPGFASVATFPDKSPTPAPASPPWLALGLAAGLALLGARRAAQPA